MRKWISYPHREGTISRQAHADFPAEAIYEREVGRSGFFGPATHLHHKHPPTGWSGWEGPLRPRAYDLNELPHGTPAPWDAPLVLHNAQCKLRIWRCDQAMTQLFRNADGDDLLFIHGGSGELFCDYGHLSYRDGDYILVPRSTSWRIEPASPTTMLLVETSNGAYQLPEKGLVGPHAIFDEAVLDVPAIDDAFKAQQTEDEWQVVIKRRGALSTVTYPYNPLDAIGWHGNLSVARVNWRDIRPLMSHRYHLPPSAHTTFVADGFVICTFVPRPIESDPGALKVPFYHNNDDYDEVIFYHAGDFFSRDNIKPGMLTFHPAGFTHGPHPKAFAKAMTDPKTFTDEVAVMIDARDALEQGPGLAGVEWQGYVDSWKPKQA
ncbi:homogentisate 1,2-dioxygenase [Chromobacterium violaceum]|uniref:homogentisate 1,2-dioxygenase n=1 Tax=Chromobacterium violaceum TaxID=536 RepID=UPI0009DAA540|nr:homogentisate 1,2-dioxygenase [Chromobacterium violaceum]OQS49332.1 homogentisate 1,2-dioxygenase [Chromobacterium violaceum]OQS51726.1 homogentisate 1,2-dioxygenase [Chromobacterium violaceum]QRO31164.1 homogentisate 1,2-dioxygenase [Chromobacterium violaceum]QRQ19035.1 homogentisate 1,2-dioxygenase [Chromobacterium violaceum]